MKISSSILLTCVFLAVAGCGGGMVRGQPPLVRIAALQLEEQEIRARVDVHNPNGVDMEVAVFEMSMSLGDANLGRHSARPGIKIHPNGTEEIPFDFPADENAGLRLAELERGEINSLQYSVSGRVRDSSGGGEDFSQQGYLYPVPGRPGRFRGAGPQREQTRDW